jgi:hypothetical protein
MAAMSKLGLLVRVGRAYKCLSLVTCICMIYLLKHKSHPRLLRDRNWSQTSRSHSITVLANSIPEIARNHQYID